MSLAVSGFHLALSMFWFISSRVVWDFNCCGVWFRMSVDTVHHLLIIFITVVFSFKGSLTRVCEGKSCIG